MLVEFHFYGRCEREKLLKSLGFSGFSSLGGFRVWVKKNFREKMFKMISYHRMLREFSLRHVLEDVSCDELQASRRRPWSTVAVLLM